MIRYIFWIVLGTIFYVYFGYPLLIMLLARLRTKAVDKADIMPSVSLIIAVHNGEKIIRTKIEDVLALEYPREKLEVIVASDCSTDGTDAIVAEYEKRNVGLARLPERGGKTSAQNLAIRRASGEIIVFTDVYPQIERKSLKRIVRNFNDPRIGCVTSEDREWRHSGGQGESMYVKFGTWLRRLESRVDSSVGASGSFYAIRRNIALNLNPGLSRDFASSLIAKKHGLRTVAEREARSYVETVGSIEKEFRRKVRTVVRGLDVLFSMKELLNPFKYGFYSVQLISQKLLKWTVSFLGIALIVCAVILCESFSCTILLIISVLLCIVVAGGIVAECFGIRKSPLSVPLYLVISSCAVLIGWVMYLSRSSEAYWEPTERSAGGARRRNGE